VLSVIGYYTWRFFRSALLCSDDRRRAPGSSIYSKRRIPPPVLSGVMARVMSSRLVCARESRRFVESALVPGFEPTLSWAVAWMLAVIVYLPPYVLLGVAVSLALTRARRE